MCTVKCSALWVWNPFDLLGSNEDYYGRYADMRVMEKSSSAGDLYVLLTFKFGKILFIFQNFTAQKNVMKLLVFSADIFLCGRC